MHTGSEASADEREGKPAVRKGAQGPTMFSFFLGSIIICRSHNLTLSDQAQVVLQLIVSLSEINVKIHSQIALAGAEGEGVLIFFHRVPNPF